MIPTRIEGATHILGKPAGMDDPCGRLHVRNEGPYWISRWQPLPDELQMLIEGGSVELSVYGGQPPVSLIAVPPPPPEPAP